jgi:hypothetical protein
MKKPEKRGRLEGRPVLEDIMRKEIKRRSNARRNRRYLLAKAVFRGLII